MAKWLNELKVVRLRLKARRKLDKAIRLRRKAEALNAQADRLEAALRTAGMAEDVQ